MGNFYANIALRTPDIDAVASALDGMRRTAFVATDGKTNIVFDEKCDEQDLNELQRLAAELSKRLNCVALAVCNHDDDVLWYALVANAAVTDTYDSNPGYFDGRADAPRGGDAEKLCDAFDAGDHRADVAALLRKPHAEIVFEIERHESLRSLLGLPQGLSTLGYRYVSRGELANVPSSTIRATGAASLVNSPRQAKPASKEAKPQDVEAMDERTRLAIERESKDLMWDTYALALHDASVPARFAPLFGVDSGNGQLLFTRLAHYVMRNDLRSGGGWIRADDLLTEFLGEREFVIVALARLLRRALDIPALTTEERAAFDRGDPQLLRRLAAGFTAAQDAARDDHA